MNKKERKAKCSAILNSCGEFVKSEEDFNFLLECFQMNPRIWKEKRKGQNIMAIGIGRSEIYGTKHFVIRREDGTTTDISYIKCIDGISPGKEIREACRNAIDEAVILPLKKKLVFPMVSSISGNTLYSLNEVHIDHYDLEFEDVVKGWIEEKGGVKHLHQFINIPKDNCTVTCFTSEEIKEDFVQYHNAHTHLQVISESENLKKGKKKGKKI
ncbi:DCL family protein [Bacteroides sp. OttesenSCG-928-N06]|nr:DCL family protein [Bacteroides sp. OttesenSCG-928-N06]